MLGSCLNVLLASREIQIYWHRVYSNRREKKYIPATRSSKKLKEQQKKKISKSFGSTIGKNLQLEKAFVLILKHGITVILKL